MFHRLRCQMYLAITVALLGGCAGTTAVLYYLAGYLFTVLAAWARSEERGGSRYDVAQQESATAEIRRREAQLAERLRREGRE